MLNHHLEHQGYALLFAFMALGSLLLCGLISIPLNMLKVSIAQPLVMFLAVLSILMVCLIIHSRFSTIEGRSLTFRDMNSIAIWNVLWTIGIVIGAYISVAFLVGAFTLNFGVFFEEKALSGLALGTLGFLIVSYAFLYLSSFIRLILTAIFNN